MLSKTLICFILLFVNTLNSQVINSPQELVEKSITFHDPESKWNTFLDTISFRLEKEKNSFSKRKIFIDNKTGHFIMWGFYEDGVLKYEVNQDTANCYFNGEIEIPKYAQQKYKLSNNRAKMYRNYYLYLCGMPMKLKDPGTILEEVEKVSNMYGQDVYRLKVSYTPEVGSDNWYFYFSSDTFELIGYSFYKQKEGDGEYILLQELITIDGIKFSKIRDWYISESGKFLGRDIIE